MRFDALFARVFGILKLAIGNSRASGVVLRMSSGMEIAPLDRYFHCGLLGGIPGKAGWGFSWVVVVCFVGVCGGGKFWGLDNDGQSRLAVWLGLFFRQEVDADAAFREDGLDFQLSTHRLDVGTQGAEVHIGALLEFGYGALVDPEDLGQVGLGELACSTKLLEGDFGHPGLEIGD